MTSSAPCGCWHQQIYSRDAQGLLYGGYYLENKLKWPLHHFKRVIKKTTYSQVFEGFWRRRIIHGYKYLSCTRLCDFNATHLSQEKPVVYKLGAGSSPTHSLKELLITSSVDMEAATDTNVTALCTMYVHEHLTYSFCSFVPQCELVLPQTPIQGHWATRVYKLLWEVSRYTCKQFACQYPFTVCRLLSFSEECVSTHKSDISHILYPIFVHIYLDLVAGGHSELGRDDSEFWSPKVKNNLCFFFSALSFYDKFVSVVGRSHKSEMKELAEVTSIRHLSSSPLAAKFRWGKQHVFHLPSTLVSEFCWSLLCCRSQKYSARMSNKAFQLMMQFLQVWRCLWL